MPQNDKRMILLALGILILPGIVFAANWYSTRGVDLATHGCAWEPEQGAYVATVNVSNKEPSYKLVEFTVQVKLTPPKGRDWPHARVREKFEAMSQQQHSLLRPHGSSFEDIAFAVPGEETGGYACEVRVSPGWQERFDNEPSEEMLQVLSQSRGFELGAGRRRMFN